MATKIRMEQRYRFELLPPKGVRGGQATGEGMMWAERARNGETVRIVEMSVAIRMLGFGAMLERFAAIAAQYFYGAHAEKFNQRLRTPGS